MENKDKAYQPLVSVVMATFNEPKTIIARSILSILNQDYKNLELIIADDSTNQETIETIDAIAKQDPRVKVIRQRHRMGFVPALNQALKHAQGELIARMDGDDIAMTCRISKQVAYAISHSDIAIFGGSMNIINENDQIISERHYPTTSGKIKLWFIFRSPFAHPTIMFRREIIDHGILYDPTYKRAEDIDFFMRVYKSGYKFGNLEDKLISYRVEKDFHKKRPKEQWRSNHRTRRKFILSKPIFSIFSFIVSGIYMYIPEKVVYLYYAKENNVKCNNSKI